MVIGSHHILKGTLFTPDSKESIQIEYRFHSTKECEVFTKVKHQIFHIEEKNYFSAISNLLDNLPLNSSVVFNHIVPIMKDTMLEFAPMEECLFPYKVKGSGTVLYKLKLKVGNIVYETEPSTDFGGSQGILGGALEQLRNLTQNKFGILVCYFCRFLVEYNEYGGTDYRHDQLYCFRGKNHLLQKIEQMYPNLSGQEKILEQTIGNISALHSCDAFEIKVIPRP